MSKEKVSAQEKSLNTFIRGRARQWLKVNKKNIALSDALSERIEARNNAFWQTIPVELRERVQETASELADSENEDPQAELPQDE
jgi:hypothetical protein